MNCDVRCRQKCKLLGSLEQKIIDVLWQANTPTKPAEVLKNINGRYSYTTIMTVLKRMTAKGILKRELRGRVYFYFPSKSKEIFVNNCLDDLFTRLFDCYGPAVIEPFHRAAKKAKLDSKFTA